VAPHALGRFFDAVVQPFAQPASLFRRDLFRALGGFDSHYRLVADFDFYRRAWQAGHRFARVGYPSVAAFRIHAGQLHTKEGAADRLEKQRLRAARVPMRRRILYAWDAVSWKAANAPNVLMRLMRGAGVRAS
jgi:GT2 family glycosyltransferase